jgi:excisionase family DNA binding protein
MSVVTVPDTLTTSQVARYLGLSRQHTIRLARDGRLPHIDTPLGRLFPRADVERLAEERRERD